MDRILLNLSEVAVSSFNFSSLYRPSVAINKEYENLRDENDVQKVQQVLD
jgi:hypothetical protein